MNLYPEVLALSRSYLGNNADRFVDNQIKHHLHSNQRYIAPGDLSIFTEWAAVSMALLTDDEQLVRGYAARLNRLATVLA